MKNRLLRIAFCLLAPIALAFASDCFAQPSALEDEPNELNWDVLGGSVASFSDFASYADSNPTFRKRLLARKPSNIFGRSTEAPKKIANVWAAPDAFDKANGWGTEQIEGESVLSYPSGHGGGWTRAKVTIPRSGYYRVCARYYHEQGTSSTFVVRLEDPRVFELGPMQSIVQDVFSYRFDAAEMGRKSNPLPTRREEPTGFLWESTPTVWMEKGERALTVSGTIHEGPFAPRRIAAIVVTQEPLGTPALENESAPSKETRSVAAIWARRPVAGGNDRELVELWKEWRGKFYQKLASDEALGIELDRMKSLVAFDPESNLIGTPKQIAEEKERFENTLNSVPKDSFTQKIEGEEFEIADGWYVEGSSDASASKILAASYGDISAHASYELEIPRACEYSFWSRLIELPGYLSKFSLILESEEGVCAETVFCADVEENKKSPGARWACTKCNVPAGKLRVTLKCEGGPGLTYRRYDALIVTDREDWAPEGRGEIVPPKQGDGLSLWASDPWQGFTRLDAPSKPTKLDAPIDVELPLGGVEFRSILIRNEGDEPKTLRLRIKGDEANVLSWRVQALTFSPQFGWVPHVLLKRGEITVPPRQTSGVWLTFDGDKTETPERFTIELSFEDASKAKGAVLEKAAFNVVRKGDLRAAPTPLVGGWSAPYEMKSCWNAFKKLGVNVLNDLVIPSDEAKRYGIKLFVKLNDENVSKEHVAEIVKSFQDYGYDYGAWAWSFMDEPGAGASDRWVELAKEFKKSDPNVRVWCNPGELWGAPAESDLKMLPYVDCYCPYADHFWQNGGGVEAYQKELRGEGRKYALRLTYTTPCFGEKAPGAPGDMFGPMTTSLQNELDGWMFYVLMGRYEYCNSLWDEVNAYVADQAVSLYPGVGDRTLYTRTAMAIRAAVDQWRKARLDAEKTADEAQK